MQPRAPSPDIPPDGGRDDVVAFEVGRAEGAAESKGPRVPGKQARPGSADADAGLPRARVVFSSATHDILFAPREPRCDACDGTLGRTESVAAPDEPASSAASSDDEEAEGGHGLYIWVRNGEVVYEEPPLCANCAAAITITALQRWEIEEEEG